MKILCVGDLHYRLVLPYADAFKDGRREEWEAVKNKILETAESCDAVVLLGDVFNSKNNPSVVIKEFVMFLKAFGDKEIHVIAGNHDRSGHDTALDFLKKLEHPNWFIYSEPSQAKISGQSACFIPYMTPALLGVETKEEGVKALTGMFPEQAAFCFAHHAISGYKGRGLDTDALNEIVLPREELEKHFEYTFAGHIHAHDRKENIVQTGSIFTQETGEHDKRIWTLEYTPGHHLLDIVELPVRGIYKVFYGKSDLSAIPASSIVKCFVTERGTDLEKVNEELKRFDASMIVEAYENEREKAHYDESMALDLSLDGLLKMYAEAKSLPYENLKAGMELIKV